MSSGRSWALAVACGLVGCGGTSGASFGVAPPDAPDAVAPGAGVTVAASGGASGGVAAGGAQGGPGGRLGLARENGGNEPSAGGAPIGGAPGTGGTGSGGFLQVGGAPGSGGAPTSCDLSLCSSDPIPVGAAHRCSLAQTDGHWVTLCGYTLVGAGGSPGSGGAGSGGAMDAGWAPCPTCLCSDGAYEWVTADTSPCRCLSDADCPACNDSSPMVGGAPVCRSGGACGCGLSSPSPTTLQLCCAAGYAPQITCVTAPSGTIDRSDCPGAAGFGFTKNATMACAPNPGILGVGCITQNGSIPP